MWEHMSLGSVPCDEECAQVGTINYAAKARTECRAYKAQLEATHLSLVDPDSGAMLHVHSNPHDFGSYYEVCVTWDGTRRESERIAYDVENNLPEHWTAEAIAAIC